MLQIAAELQSLKLKWDPLGFARNQSQLYSIHKISIYIYMHIHMYIHINIYIYVDTSP